MLRIVAVACLVLSLPASLDADEVCVACEGPAATYRCTLEQPKRDLRFQLEETAQRYACEMVLAKAGPHASCRVVANAEPCDGPARTVTLTDVQRAIAGDGESTYQPGVFELARRKVHATWLCVASLFNDC